MSRAGREPAEDVKRRLIANCEEVGLAATGTMRLIGDVRLIVVDTSTISLIAQVPTNGRLPDTVDVRCGTSENPFDPCLRGRGQVPMADLLSALRETLDEREKVVAAMQLGIEGPYRFERSEWVKPELLT